MDTQKVIPAAWQFPIKAGLLAGGVTTYTAFVGMLAAFNERQIIRGEVVTLGRILLFATVIGVGYFIARGLHDTNAPFPLYAKSALAGLVAALPLIALIILDELLTLRPIFVNINRDLMSVLTFERDSRLLGSILLLASYPIASIIGAGVYRIPQTMRRALLIGLAWVIGVGMMSELVSLVIRENFGRDIVRFLMSRDVLKWQTALGLFVLTFGISYFWALKGEMLREWSRPSRERLHALSQPKQHRPNSNMPDSAGAYSVVKDNQWMLFRLFIYSPLIVFLIILPFAVGTFLSEVLTNVGLFILMGLGLNIAIGLAGLLDLGYVTNFAVGAYVAAVLTSTGALGFAEKTGIDFFNFWLVLPISLLAAMLTGFILAVPVLKMRGDYLAIATLGFGEIIRLLALSDWLSPLIGGAQGVLMIPKPVIFGIQLSGPQQIYYVILAASILALIVSTRLNNSRTGRQWMAMREDEDVASAMGISTARAKLLAFTLSAATGGLAGAIFAGKVGTIFPNSFSLLVSINVLSLIIIGGMGSIPGIVVGSLVLIGVPDLLREFSEFRLLLYGALLVFMMLSRPQGLWPSAVHQREIQRGDEAIPAPGD